MLLSPFFIRVGTARKLQRWLLQELVFKQTGSSVPQSTNQDDNNRSCVSIFAHEICPCLGSHPLISDKSKIYR